MIAQSSPQVWLLLGHKIGDNNQVLALAEALGWPFVSKRLYYRSTELWTNRLLGPNCLGIIGHRSSPLEPPWPDLVISAGRRNEPIARWIQQQAMQQQHPVRLVHLGRPWARLTCFDLIVTTPQYQLPALPNVLINRLPLHRVTSARLAMAGTEWQERFTSLAKPWIGVLIGGHSGPYRFDTYLAAKLAKQLNALATEQQGSLLLTTSARTPIAAIEALRQQIQVPAFFHQWRPDDQDNPYYAVLGLADLLVVTAESVSMLTEACMTDKPVLLFDLGESVRTRSFRPIDPADRPWWQRLHHLHLRVISHHLAMRFAPKRMVRDVRWIHRQLLQDQRVAWLHDGLHHKIIPASLQDELSRTVARVQQLFALEVGSF